MADGWQRIWHGDSALLAGRIPDGKIDCIITDPPFGVDNQSNMAVTQAGKQYARKIANDDDPAVAMAIFMKVMSHLLPKVKPDADVYVFTSYQVLKEWLVMCDDLFGLWGWELRRSYSTEEVSVLTFESNGVTLRYMSRRFVPRS
jgi:adenine-specific DNA-methyltransferase